MCLDVVKAKVCGSQRRREAEFLGWGRGNRLDLIYQMCLGTYRARVRRRVAWARKRQISIRQARPDIAITAVADGAPDNWTFLEALSPEAQAVDFWHACEHLRTASDHAVDPRWFETYRHILRHDPRGSTRIIRRCAISATR